MPRVAPQMSSGSKPIPPRRVRAAAIASAVFGGIVWIAASLPQPDGETPGAPDLGYALLFGAATAGGAFLIILFIFALMQAGHEWRRRGGHPDPFTRE